MYKIIVKRSPDNRFYWYLETELGQLICSSDRYNRKFWALHTAKLLKKKLKEVSIVDDVGGIVGSAF